MNTFKIHKEEQQQQKNYGDMDEVSDIIDDEEIIEKKKNPN